MKKHIAYFLAFFISLSFAANNETSHHCLDLNIGGPLGIGTMEYQYRMIVSEKHTLAATAGLGTYIMGYSVPVGFLYTFGKKSQLILGTQFVSLFSAERRDPGFSFSPRIGFRKVITDNTFAPHYIQVYFSPLIPLNDSSNFLPFGGIGLGVYL